MISWVKFIWQDSNLLIIDDYNRSGLSPKLSPSDSLYQNWKKGMLVFYWSLELKEAKCRAAIFCYGQTRSLVLAHIAVSKIETVKQPLKGSTGLVSSNNLPTPKPTKQKHRSHSLWEWPLPKFLTSITEDVSTSHKWLALVRQTPREWPWMIMKKIMEILSAK